MAKYLEFDKKHFGVDGLIPLKRGDDWKLDATIIEELSNYRREVNLTDIDVKVFFPSASTGSIEATNVVKIDPCGKIELTLAASASTGVALAQNGTSVFARLENLAGHLETVETKFEPIQVQDQGFRTF